MHLSRAVSQGAFHSSFLLVYLMADQSTTPTAADASTPTSTADAVVNPKLLIPKKDGPLAEVARLVAEA
jgi:hypothetical protein